MTLSSFAAYIKQLWRNKPDTSTPVTAERLAHMEEGIKGNSDAIEEIAAAVVSQIINDPDKIASMAAVYAVNQKVATLDGKVGDTAQLPDGATDVVTAIAKQNSDLLNIKIATYTMACGIQQSGTTMPFKTQTGLDLIAQADYPKGCKLIVPLCAYNGDKFAVIGLTSNRYLNLNGDNLTYTCVVAYLYSD